MYSIIRALYTNVKCCVKYATIFSKFFSVDTGVLPGEALSPLLFSLYLNDFENEFIVNNYWQPIALKVLSLYLLLCADDTVLYSDTPDGLQNLLNSFQLYCNKWKLSVNIDKTKIVIFRKGEHTLAVQWYRC